MASRTTVYRAGLAAGAGAGAATVWLLGTASGRARLATLVGRGKAADDAGPRLTHIELPDRPWLRELGIAVDEGTVVGAAASGAEEHTAASA